MPATRTEETEKQHESDPFAWPPQWWVCRPPHEIQFLHDDDDVEEDHRHDEPAALDVRTGTACRGSLTPCNSLAMARRFLRVGVPAIDGVLGCGIPSGTIFEIAGEAGSGKTQFSLALTVKALLPMVKNHFESFWRQHSASSEAPRVDIFAALSPPPASKYLARGSEVEGGVGSYAVYYINTEGSVPVARLKQIMESSVMEMMQTLFKSKAHVEIDDSIDPWLTSTAARWTTVLLDFVFIECIAEDFELWEVLCTKLSHLSLNFELKLVVIDSIAALFRVMDAASTSTSITRGGGDKTNYALRATHLFRTSAVLRRVATEADCWIVCTNQVSGDFGPKARDNPDAAAVKPSLGLAWASCVNCRVLLRRATQRSQLQGGVDEQERVFSVEFAPHVPPGSCFFRIESGGLRSSRT